MLSHPPINIIVIFCLFLQIISATVITGRDQLERSRPVVVRDISADNAVVNSTDLSSMPRRFLDLTDEQYQIGFNMHGIWAPSYSLEVYAFPLPSILPSRATPDALLFTRHDTAGNFKPLTDYTTRVTSYPYNLQVVFTDLVETVGVLQINVLGKIRDRHVERVVWVPKPDSRLPVRSWALNGQPDANVTVWGAS